MIFHSMIGGGIIEKLVKHPRRLAGARGKTHPRPRERTLDNSRPRASILRIAPAVVPLLCFDFACFTRSRLRGSLLCSQRQSALLFSQPNFPVAFDWLRPVAVTPVENGRERKRCFRVINYPLYMLIRPVARCLCAIVSGRKIEKKRKATTRISSCLRPLLFAASLIPIKVWLSPGETSPTRAR